MGLSFLHGEVEIGDRVAQITGVSADLVEGAQGEVAVERRVLHAFGHYRGAQLGEAHRESSLIGAGVFQGEQTGDKS